VVAGESGQLAVFDVGGDSVHRVGVGQPPTRRRTASALTRRATSCTCPHRRGGHQVLRAASSNNSLPTLPEEGGRNSHPPLSATFRTVVPPHGPIPTTKGRSRRDCRFRSNAMARRG